MPRRARWPRGSRPSRSAPPSAATQLPEAYLRSVALDANTRINDLAAEDESRSGMGTTFTAALVDGDDVSFAHVGDSRAYLFRDGDLRMLTADHSLVEELLRQGKLTKEQAEDHPQRSIITRALGPEREVEVDTMTYRAKPDDVYMLCSDGLTTMVKDDMIAAIMARAASLEDAASQLIEQANLAGGRDNITVVLFRVGEGDASPADDTATLVGPTAAEAGLTGEAVREGAAARSATARARARSAPPARKKPSRVRTALKALAVVLVLGGIVAAAIIGARQVYFLGGDEGGRVALFRGLPYDMPLGIELYSEVESSPIQVSSLSEQDQNDRRRPLAALEGRRPLADRLARVQGRTHHAHAAGQARQQQQRRQQRWQPGGRRQQRGERRGRRRAGGRRPGRKRRGRRQPVTDPASATGSRS